jgi:predicted ATP-dependent serine protease
MTDIDDRNTKKLERVASGIAGLDTILGGGFIRGGVYLVHAKPGSGKTILGNQMGAALLQRDNPQRVRSLDPLQSRFGWRKGLRDSGVFVA